MILKRFVISLLLATSSLFAIDAVTGLTVGTPHNTGTTTNDASIDFTWTPPSGVSKYYYKLDTNSSNYDLVGEGNYSTLNSNGSGMTVTATADGSYYLHIVAVDSSNDTSAPAIVQVASAIDITAGSVTLTTAGSFSGSKAVTLTGSESGTLYYTVDGTDVNTSVTDSNGSTKLVTSSSSAPATTITLAVTATVKAKLKDSTGNIQSSENNATYTITNNPSLLKANDDSNVDGSTINTTTTNALKVSGTDFTRYMYRKSTTSAWTTVSDINTTISSTEFSTSGTYTYYIRGGDAFNFQSDSAKTTVTFTVDNTAPSSLTMTTSKGTASESNASTITFAADFQVSMSSDDSNATIYYTTDGSTPTTSSSVYSSAITIDTSSVTTGNTGTSTVKMLARDSAGNDSSVKSVTFTIDKQQPTLTMPSTQEISSGATLNVTMSVNDGNATIYYLVSDSNTTTVDAVKNSGTTGTTATIGQNPSNSQQSDQYRYLHALAVDIAGNGDEDTNDIETVTYTFSASAVTLSLSGVTADSTIATKSDYNASATSTISLTINGQSGTTYYYKFKFNDSNISGESSNTYSSTTTLSLADLSDGNNTLYVGVDSNDSGDFNLSEENLSFVVDNTPPSTVSQSDVNYTTSTRDVSLSMPSGASSIIYTLNGGSPVTLTSTSTVTITQDVNSTTTLVAYAEDSVGNESNRTTATYTRNPEKTRILSASNVDFGSQNNYAKSTQNITLTNSGNSETTVQSTTLTSSEFTISNNGCSTPVTAGATCIIAVDFNTTTSGAKSATLQIGYNGTSSTELNVSLSGTGVNNIPVTTYTDDINISEDNNSSGVLTATDVEGSSLSFYIDTNTTKGTISLETNGSFTYAPNANYNGIDSFIYYAYDGESNSTDRNITINISAVNDLPNVEVNGSTDSSITIETSDGNFTLTYDANDTADNEDINVSVDSSQADGNVTLDTVNKTISYIKNTNAGKGTGKYFIVSFDDGSGTDVNRTVNISLGNTKPNSFNIGSTTFNEDSGDNNISISFSDDMNSTDVVLVSVETNASKGTVTILDTNVTIADGNQTTITYNTDANATGSDSFVLKFDDGYGGIVYQTITVTLNNVNDAPYWSSVISSPQTTAEDTDLNVTLSGTDIDNNDLSLSYSAIGSDNNSTVILSITGSTLTISPVKDKNGDLNITVVVSDGNLSASQTFDLNVTAVDDIPVIAHLNPVRFRSDSNESNKTVQVNASDVDGDTISYEVNSSKTSIVVVDINSSGLLNLDPQGTGGNSLVTVKAITTDANVTKSFYVTVKDTNVSFDRNGTVDTSEANKTKTTFSGLDNGKSLELLEDDNGTVSATLSGISSDSNVILAIDVVGATISVDENGSLTTSLIDGSITKQILVKSNGSTKTQLDNNSTDHVFESSYTSGETNTTVTAGGDIETKIIIGSNRIDITLDTNGTSKSSIVIGSNTTEITNSAIDTNTTVDSSGNVKAKFTMQSKAIELDVSATDGTITPSIPSAILPSSFPAGTKTVIENNTTIKFQLSLPSKLEFN